MSASPYGQLGPRTSSRAAESPRKPINQPLSRSSKRLPGSRAAQLLVSLPILVAPPRALKGAAVLPALSFSIMLLICSAGLTLGHFPSSVL